MKTKTKKNGSKPSSDSGFLPGVGLALYSCDYDRSPCLVFVSPGYTCLLDGIDGQKRFIRSVEPNEVSAKRKPHVQKVVAEAIVNGWIAREDGEAFLDRLFSASCLRETWRKENLRP